MGLFARTRSMVFIATLCAVGAAGAYGFLVFYIVHTHAASSELSVAVEVERNKEQGVRATGRLLQELAEEESAISRHFVGAEDIVSFIEEIEGAGRDAGIALEVASVNLAPDLDDSHEWLTLALKVEGSWEKLFHFTVLLETMPVVIELDQVSFKFIPDESDSKTGTWEGLFNIRAAKLKSLQP